MIFEKELITKITALLFTVYVMTAHLIPWVVSRLSMKSQKPEDIDLMIQRKKEQFKFEIQDQLSPEINKNPIRSKLIKEMQWGTGDEINRIQKEFKSLFSHQFSVQEIVMELKTLYSKNQINDNTTDKEVENLLVIRLLIATMLKEIQQHRPRLLKELALKFKLPLSHFVLAFQAYILSFLSKKSSDIYLLENSLQSKNQLEHEIIIDKIMASNFSVLQFVDDMNLHIQRQEAIIPILHPKSSDDIHTAYDILGVNHRMSLDEIKKSYKKLCLLKHPDKVSEFQFSSQQIKQVEDNFKALQMAMSIIQNFHGKKS